MDSKTRNITAIAAALLVALALTAPAEAQMPDPNTAGIVVSGIEIVGGELDIIDFILEPLVNDTIADGTIRVLAEIRELDDDGVENDDFIEVAVYQGIDQDGDPSDDFDGAEPFLIDPATLNPDGTPIVLFTPGSLTMGFITAGPASFDLGGGIILDDVLFEGTVTPGGAEFTSVPTMGAIPAEFFEMIDAPPPLPGNLLDYLFLLGAELDVDLDGDGVNDAFSVEVVISGVSCVVLHPILEPDFPRGDVDTDGVLNALIDVLFLLDFGFLGGPAPLCSDAADVDDDGTINALIDSIYLLEFGFIGGPPPPSPFPGCGPDPTDDTLDCAEYAPPCT